MSAQEAGIPIEEIPMVIKKMKQFVKQRKNSVFMDSAKVMDGVVCCRQQSRRNCNI